MLALYIILGTIGYVIGGGITTAIWLHEDRYSPGPIIWFTWPVCAPVGLLILACTKLPRLLSKASKKQNTLGKAIRVVSFPYTKTVNLLNPPPKPPELPKAVAKNV